MLRALGRGFGESEETRNKLPSGDVDHLRLPRSFSENSPEVFAQELAAIAKQCSEADFLAICYHGQGQSPDFSHNFVDGHYTDVKVESGLHSLYIGIKQIMDKFTSRGLMRLTPDKIDAIARSLCAAPRIALMVDATDMNRQVERLLHAAILKQAKETGTKIFIRPNTDSSSRKALAQDIANS